MTMIVKEQELQLDGYSIYIGDQLAKVKDVVDTLDPTTILILVDENTRSHCLPFLETKWQDSRTEILIIPPGETHKSLTTSQQIWDKLASIGADRRSLVINLGGGVIGDMGGFCASTYMRGIPFVQIPTTLLAQVDASIGGKVAIDHLELKNLIGCFANPYAVFIDSHFLKTLSSRELRSGYAEVIKHALIADGNQWSYIKDISDLKHQDWDSIITSSLKIKRDIVRQDPHEKGLRKILNFGHTIGHALESVMLNSEQTLLHGEAIAIGMIAESYLSNKLAGLTPRHLENIGQYILNIYGKLPIDMVLHEEVMDRMQLDKKNEKGKINFTLLTGIGQAQINYEVNPTDILESLNYYQDLQIAV